MVINKMLKKVIGYEEIFTIAYRNIQDREACFLEKKPMRFKIWDDLKDYWYADPIVFEKDNFLYLFIEMFDRKKYKGVIGVSKFENGKFSTPQVIIKEKFHLSYPYVFENQNDIFMIPETSEVKQNIFYKCIEFPYKWIRHTEISCLELKVDNNVIQLDNKHYLMSALLGKNPYKSKMHFEELLFDNEIFQLKEVSIKLNDSYNYDTRGAGRWFQLNGTILRPAQVSKDGMYGYSLKFLEPSMNHCEYKEKELYELKPEKINFQYKNKIRIAEGTHTYARGNNIEVIDIKLTVFNKMKWINRLRKHMLK